MLDTLETSPLAFPMFPRIKAAWQALTHKAEFTSDVLHPSAWLVNWALGYRTGAGVDISPAAAMTLPAYYAALRAISEDIGKLPLCTYRRLTPRGKDKAYDHPLYTLLHDAPNEWMSAMTWRETLSHHCLAWGNGYSEIIRQAGTVVALGRPIHPSRVRPRFDEDGELVYDVHHGEMLVASDTSNGFGMETYRQRDILHLRGLGDGIVGYSIAQMAAESLGLTLAAQQFGSSFFGNGTHQGGIFTHPQSLSDTALAHLRDSLDGYRGSQNAMKTMILEEGMSFERASIPPEDAQFLETRQFQVDEVARWFRIPPHKIQSLLHATFTNIEHQGLEYVVDTLQPWLVRWEQELKRKLFADDPAHFAEHQVLGLLRGDQVARANFYRALFSIGALSPNDIRELENENPIADAEGEPDPAGNLYYIQNIMAPLGQIAGTMGPPVQPVGAGQPFPARPGSSNGHAAPDEDEEEY